MVVVINGGPLLGTTGSVPGLDAGGGEELETAKMGWLVTAEWEGGRRIGKWLASKLIDSTERRAGLARDSKQGSCRDGRSNLGKFDVVIASIEEIHHSLNSVGVESISLEYASLRLLPIK